jgi:diaminopimelate decarboxylase
MTPKESVNRLKDINTPYYYYNTELLRQTLDALNKELAKYENYHVHYAIKANANPIVLKPIREAGLGIDCVSGGEIDAAIKAGFAPESIMFAGVGKTDEEILKGLDCGIGCFNVESIPELEVINEIAMGKGKKADICLRINPNVGAHTHTNITTGLSENKFGIDMAHMLNVIKIAKSMEGINFCGLHFHIGSQILDMSDFVALSNRINEIQDLLCQNGIEIKIIDVGGGLGIDYDEPEAHPIPQFKEYFEAYHNNLKLRPAQELHFELGRAIVAQCGSLITKVLYVKDNTDKKFVIVDAGMTELIRPALYGAHHKIVNLTGKEAADTYDVVGPICESSDVFDTGIQLNKTQRGDLLAILSAGAYGETMASQYNCRALPQSYSDEDIMAES